MKIRNTEHITSKWLNFEFAIQINEILFVFILSLTASREVVAMALICCWKTLILLFNRNKAMILNSIESQTEETKTHPYKNCQISEEIQQMS